jgi:2-polyprenyl-3-methyl-5-hydroxy-6-metoxy-1,4-benzoquinol methylase
MTRLAARTRREEQMDSVELDAETYARVLRDLARVNRWTFTAQPVLRFLDKAIGRLNRFRLLDVGFGAGDMLRAIDRWAQKRGVTAELVGVDLNPRSEAIARAATPPSMAISYYTGDYREVLGPFDFIISSQVAHHMSDRQLSLPTVGRADTRNSSSAPPRRSDRSRGQIRMIELRPPPAHCDCELYLHSSHGPARRRSIR